MGEPQDRLDSFRKAMLSELVRLERMKPLLAAPLGGNPTIYNQYPAGRTYFAARSFSDLNQPGAGVDD